MFYGIINEEVINDDDLNGIIIRETTDLTKNHVKVSFLRLSISIWN